MKTSSLFSTLLALALSMTVSSQTHNRQADHRTLAILGAKQNQVAETAQTAQSGTIPTSPDKKASASVRKIYPTLVSQEESTKLATNKNIIDNNTYNFFNNSNCYNTIIYAGELIKQAESLSDVEKSVRKQAEGKSAAEKTTWLNSADELKKQAELKLIQASEIAGKINLEKFKKNEETFSKLAELTHATDLIVEKANALSAEAGFEIKMAKELRQEAYAMHNNTAKLGVLNNAEEKEIFAIDTQEKAIGLLQKYANYVGSNLTDVLATK